MAGASVSDGDAADHDFQVGPAVAAVRTVRELGRLLRQLRRREARRRGEAQLTYRELAAKTGAVSIHAYDDPRVLAGQGTLGMELEEQVRGLDSVLIATGGGVPLNEDNMKRLSDRGEIVWLKIRPETVLARAGNLSSRPLIDQNNPKESVENLMKQREKYYARAHHVIESDELSAAEVVGKISAALDYPRP